MFDYLGIDTSNYTTSAALFDSNSHSLLQNKKLLPVKSGEKGIRQSDAVFHHTVQLPEVLEALLKDSEHSIKAVGVSVTPTSEDGSYMPCFLTGKAVAEIISLADNIPVYRFTHQQGHIASVIAKENREDLLNKEFIAFHLSGGTTQALYVKPDKENIFDIKVIAQSADLKAGQAIDRAGVMLGLQFPCGKELDRLSLLCEEDYNIKPSMIGLDCSLSGIENKYKKMFEEGKSKEAIAKFCIMSIISAVDSMLERIIEEYGSLPILFSGGVSSNTLLRDHFKTKCSAVFTTPEYSSDNAAGIAYLTYLKNKEWYFEGRSSRSADCFSA